MTQPGQQAMVIPPVQVTTQVLKQGPDGKPWVQVVTQYGLMVSTLVVDANTARQLADIYQQQLSKAAEEARKQTSGLIVPAVMPDLSALRRDLNGHGPGVG